ncbi:penicillin amidase [Massilia sp. WF1]|uniref:penicillin acylase family protein n=1 Tax=unclassified Massilia TaxID=2609279 RepID=UPI00064A12F9|nr:MULTISPECIES: penicillin acylase family protein [unclassified Massilia]ALK96474.1 penicillin amidase [Massilia sp. WG5]KLU37773.1 penicillin amidase [Massilia sp. WF1]
MARRAWLVWGRRILLLLAALLALAVLGAWLFLRASLAQLDGKRSSPLLGSSVTVTRDAIGVPTISGASRIDLAYATGFVHAQERFFQMDLLRRSAAGELAELFGPKALPLDRAHRMHRFRAYAGEALARLSPEQRLFVERYAAGVNDGLNALGARPFEYALTGAAPRPWTPADSLLAVWAMYLDLQGNQEPRELARGWLARHLDPAQRAFLLPEASRWDAPLDVPLNAPALAAAAPIPASAPAWWGRKEAVPPRQVAGLHFADSVGSNNYAVAGTRSSSGAAIVSDDMHLGLQLPNTWYRMALRFPDAKGAQRRVVGVSLPGAPPLVIVGSNGHVAWAFTNSYADTLDLVRLGTDPARAGQVKLPSGWETPREVVETILVKGQAPARLRVRETSLGPIREAGGELYAVHWVAHSPQAVGLEHLKLETAGTLDEALAAAAVDGIPAQNIVAGDDRGNIGWTVAGVLPRRDAAGRGLAVTFPLGAEGDAPTWNGLLAPDEYPRVVNPAGGQLVTANNRQLAGPDAQLIGDGGFDLGARAHQLSDGVRQLGDKADVPAVFRVALDDRALYVQGWRDRLLALLDEHAVAGHPERAEVRRLLKDSWDGHASTGSSGYRLAQQFRWSLYELVFAGANAEMEKLDPKANMAVATSRWPVVLVRLLDERPAAWLPPAYASWQDLQLAAVDRTIADVTKDGKTLAQATWGVRNTAEIAHPISMALPFLKRWLGAPPDQLPGDANMPRVAGPKFGQSERLTVSPGREEEGLYDMPGGQSGHPLSPWFLGGHEDWVHGKPTPLLPGPVEHTLIFAPRSAPRASAAFR